MSMKNKKSEKKGSDLFIIQSGVEYGGGRL